MVRKSSENCLKLLGNGLQGPKNGVKLSENCQEMVRKWSGNSQDMVRIWSGNGQEMVKNGLKWSEMV